MRSTCSAASRVRWTDADVAVAQALADVATIGILHQRVLTHSELVNQQLQTALNTRLIIEQAKGVLAERGAIDMDRAFNLLRSHARKTNGDSPIWPATWSTAPTPKRSSDARAARLTWRAWPFHRKIANSFWPSRTSPHCRRYAGDTRGPLTVPIWYQYTPGGEPWILTGPASRKARLIEANGFFSLMVERLEPTGALRRRRRIGQQHRARHRRAPGGDHPPLPQRGSGRQYLEFARNELGEHVVISMKPEHWLSADMGSF